MTERQQAITTIDLAWQHFLPGERLPSIKHMCAWIAVAPMSRILDVLEMAGARYRANKLTNPDSYVWVLLHKFQRIPKPQ